MSEKQKNNHTVFHVQFMNGTHCYFGSIAAIFEVFKPETIGIKQSSLYSFNIEENRPYSNKLCTIYKGSIVRKKGNRRDPASYQRDFDAL